MLLDAIALVILLGLMLVPLVNIIVGVTVVAGFAGPPSSVGRSHCGRHYRRPNAHWPLERLVYDRTRADLGQLCAT